MSRWTSASVYLRPIRRLVAKRVFSGLTTAWRLADIPTRRSPSCAKATTDGVVLVPMFQRISLSIRKHIHHGPKPHTLRIFYYFRSFSF